MTHNQLKRGKNTIHNATKAQLQWMIKERDEHIKRLNAQIEEQRKIIDFYREVIRAKDANRRL